MAELNCPQLPKGDWSKQLLSGNLPDASCRFHFSKETLPLGQLAPFVSAKSSQLLNLVESKLDVRVLLYDFNKANRIRNSLFKEWKPSGLEEQETINYFVRSRGLDSLPREALSIEFVPPHFYGPGERASKRPHPEKSFFLISSETTRGDLLKLVMFALNYTSNDHAKLETVDGVIVDRRSSAGMLIRELDSHLTNLKSQGSPEPFTANTRLSLWRYQLDELERDYNKRFDINTFALDNAKLLKLTKEERYAYSLTTLNSIGTLDAELRPYEREKIAPVPGITVEVHNEVDLRIKRIRGKIEEMRSRYRPATRK